MRQRLFMLSIFCRCKIFCEKYYIFREFAERINISYPSQPLCLTAQIFLHRIRIGIHPSLLAFSAFVNCGVSVIVFDPFPFVFAFLSFTSAEKRDAKKEKKYTACDLFHKRLSPYVSLTKIRDTPQE